MAKNLTLSVLKRLDAELFNTKKEITLSNDYTLQIETRFRPSVIEQIFDKLMNIYKIVSKQEDESLQNFPFDKYSMLLLILNFTSLGSLKADSIGKELAVLNTLIDVGLFKEIVEKIEQEVPEELKKFNLKIFEIMGEKLESLKAQNEFLNVLNGEIEKNKVENEVVEDGNGGNELEETTENNNIDN